MNLTFDEDVVMVQPAKPHLEDGVIHYTHVVDEEGDPEIPSMLMHSECFDMLWFDLKEIGKDHPPKEEYTATLGCDACSSSIRMGEKVIAIYTGHLMVSRLGDVTYRPSCNEEGETDVPMVMCLSCGLEASEVDAMEAWTVLSQNGECQVCTKGKCWRAGRCFCDCHWKE